MATGYTFAQIATILNQIVADAQGRTADISAAPRDMSQFVAMAESGLSVGTDPIMTSISTVINRSIFVNRPYTGRFKILEGNSLDWGFQTRKITPLGIDSAQDNPEYTSAPADGTSADQWTVKRPKALQLNFTSAVQWAVQEPTVFEYQLKAAFRGPDELSQFLAMQRQFVLDEVEQQRENLARGTIANMIGAKINTDAANVRHMLAEYNTLTGLTLTAQDIYKPENFKPFVLWLCVELVKASDRMQERTTLYHKSIDGATIIRHTPKSMQRALILSDFMREMGGIVLPDTWHTNFVDVIPHETVLFWQNINAPDKINITPAQITSTGAHEKGKAVQQSNILAVLYDRDAMGYDMINEGMTMTPINAKSRYYNAFHHFINRWWNDTTENGVVFLLD
jgi:hypothetical protein